MFWCFVIPVLLISIIVFFVIHIFILFHPHNHSKDIVYRILDLCFLQTMLKKIRKKKQYWLIALGQQINCWLNFKISSTIFYDIYNSSHGFKITVSSCFFLILLMCYENSAIIQIYTITSLSFCNIFISLSQCLSLLNNLVKINISQSTLVTHMKYILIIKAYKQRDDEVTICFW